MKHRVPIALVVAVTASLAWAQEKKKEADPDLDARNAELQTPRVAKARRLNEGKVRELIEQNIDGPDLGFLGEAGVNVLALNRALDQLR